jgi:predicted transcriptional regulator
MKKLKLAAVYFMVILVAAAMLPVAYPASTTCFKNPAAHQGMQGEPNARTCPKMNNPQSSGAAPPGTSANQTMPPYCASVFQGDIMRNLQGFSVSVRRRLSGIKQIVNCNVLNNENRKAIYDLILTNPGIDYTEISKKTGLNKQTLRYHLGILASFHKVAIIRDGGVFYYFENDGAFPVLEKKIAIYTRSGTARDILEIIGKTPGIHQAEIARILNITAPTVIWHIRRLIGDGIVLEERQGKTIHYTLTPDGAVGLNKIMARQQKSE